MDDLLSDSWLSAHREEAHAHASNWDVGAAFWRLMSSRFCLYWRDFMGF